MGVTVTQKYRQTFRGSVSYTPCIIWSCTPSEVVSQGGRVTLERPCITCLAREQPVSSEHTHSWAGITG